MPVLRYPGLMGCLRVGSIIVIAYISVVPRSATGMFYLKGERLLFYTVTEVLNLFDGTFFRHG